MSNLLLSGLLPRRWNWEPINGFYSELIVDWLDLEVDQHIEKKIAYLVQDIRAPASRGD